MELREQTALVTGGGSGIGQAIAWALAREGCQVVVAGRNEARLRQTAEGSAGPGRLLHRACDVSDRGQVFELVDWVRAQCGDPQILVNSAGINVAKRRMAETDPADWDRLLAVNLSGAFHCMQAVLPGMRTRGGGLIVNISSISGKRASKLGGVAYCASKFGMTGLGSAVALEEAEHGIRVTNVYPGEVNTPILAQRPVPVTPEKKALMLQPDDIAACVVTIAKLPPTALVPELVITPLYQQYA